MPFIQWILQNLQQQARALSCSPPYAGGSGGACGCPCNCCPPCECYTCWTWIYACGCNCPCPSLPSPQPFEEIPRLYEKNIPSLDIDFPQFEFNENEIEYPQIQKNINKKDNMQQFIPKLPALSNLTKEQLLAAGSACTIPCFFVTVTLCVFTGCCFVTTSNFSGFSFMAVNPSTMKLKVDGSDDFQVSINGEGTTAQIGYGGNILVSITPPSSSYGCCLVASFGTNYVICPGTFRKRDLQKGITRNYIKINPKKISERISKTKLIERVFKTKQ